MSAAWKTWIDSTGGEVRARRAGDDVEVEVFAPCNGWMAAGTAVGLAGRILFDGVRLPMKCPGCGSKAGAIHADSCPTGKRGVVQRRICERFHSDAMSR